ncbi:MAG: peptidylprolyl isomerase [Polyangiaceae bacterium]
MVKVRLVALSTLAAVGALVFSLSVLKKREFRGPGTPRTVSSAMPRSASSALVPTVASAVAPETPAGTAPSTTRDFSLLPDGKPVPELPATAPKTCGFGAILFTHEGAQFAPRKARAKTEAYELAKNALPRAEQNFAEAVKLGDPGSLADAGSIGRGILERSVEYRLFTLEKGQVSPEPIETPRGYWVLKRLK